MTDTNEKEVLESTNHADATINENPLKYVKLNVGGYLYCTTIGTLTKHDTMLRAMFSGQMEVIPDSDGYVNIDRCGKHFGTILNFLRDGNVSLPEIDHELAEIYAEAKFYCIAELAEACSPDFLKKKRETELICKVSLINSEEEEELLINSTTKPVIMLTIGKTKQIHIKEGYEIEYFYKNLELFDYLCLEYKNHMFFIKDINYSIQHCTWKFFNHGKKVTQLKFSSCSKFQEAKIFEKIVNTILHKDNQ